ncbi:hypothetical protein [Microbacterium sp. BF1]|uniref:hypothetical protein n=1 Tax=Microbacterium sp. BF1 TaxID=2821146 RepID=UPI002119F5AF|nr:hypothetical protein [Microbacterium sp. BF1]
MEGAREPRRLGWRGNEDRPAPGADAQQNTNATPLIMAAILYLIVTIPLTRFSAWLERRMAKQR